MLITRGFGETGVIYVSVPVPIQELKMSAHSWGEKKVKAEPVEDD